MTERILHGLAGAFLGGLIVVSTLFWCDFEINYLFVGIGMILCAILAFAFGESGLEWLKEIFWRM